MSESVCVSLYIFHAIPEKEGCWQYSHIFVL